MSARAASTPREGELARRVGRQVASEGRRLFRVAARATSAAHLAMQIDVSERLVFAWLAGTRRPSIDLATRVWLALGIHAEAWGLAPVTSERRVQGEALGAATPPAESHVIEEPRDAAE